MPLVEKSVVAEAIYRKFNIPLFDLVDVMAEIPTTEPKRGHWTEVKTHWFVDRSDLAYYCSCCDMRNSWKTNFCPNCGADMGCKDDSN